jgi:WD40 repeat protein/serine/threonine protein kinase
MPSSDSSRDALLERLSEEFVERYRRGECPALSEYADRHPELAAEIRELFPALVKIEHLKPVAGDRTGAFVSQGDAANGKPPERLGDYRILRDVGRGGMGIVYEAEQESLGRRVALKVLASHALFDAKHLLRFQREARSAAKLHHTNIVPVYGVGHDDGLHYYVMQFIQGLGLDQVLAELKRLRHVNDPAPAASAGMGAASAAAVAQAMLTGQHLASRERQRPEEARPRVADAPGSSASDTSIHLPGQSSPSTLSDTGRAYWQSVARVGIQVADALAYAHGQGTLHRDIKPSNLLLDGDGVVWVTDFGLAKAAADTENLTHTGDIVGTLRYMAPERFSGQSDVRSDVYALGLTLYELLTLRPAFSAGDRSQLIQQVMHDEPARPGKIDSAVPRDLETIVLKAIARDPAHRYQTAAQLADDLRRFVEDRPIRARRVSARERLWRWCRRNPAVASLTAAVASLLIGATVVSLWAAAHFERTAGMERAAREDADNARRSQQLTLADMYTSFGLAAAARDDTRQAVLWFANASKLAGDDPERADANRTRAAAWGRLAIQPVRAFVHPTEWVENNMAFHPGGRHLLTHGYDPATEETTCRLWDLEREAELPFPGNPGVVSAAAWDAKGERLAVGTLQEEVTIFRFPSGEPLQRVKYAGRIARVLFSPDGRFCGVAAGNRVRVWDCRQAAFATPELEHSAPIDTLAFHPQGELLATGCRNGSCRVFPVPAEKNTPLFSPVPHNQRINWNVCRRVGETPIPPLFLDEGRGLLTVHRHELSRRDSRTGRVSRVLSFGEPGNSNVRAIALSRDGKHVAVAGMIPNKSVVRIYDVASEQAVSPYLEHREAIAVFSVSFSPNGQTLLTGCPDHTVRLWSVPGGKPVGGPLTHPTGVSSVAFLPDGRHLATAQRGGLIRLWALPAGNPRDYRVAVGAQSFVGLSRDGRFLLPTGFNTSDTKSELRSTRVFDITTGRPVGPPLQADGIILDAAFSPDGRQVAAAVSHASSQRERGQRPQAGQLLLWDWRAGKLQHKLQLAAEPRKLDYSSDGKQLAAIGAKGELVVIDPATGTTLRSWQAPQPDPVAEGDINNGAVRFSPDNLSLLTYGTETNSAGVWDALTGKLRYELGHKGLCHDVQFSPDGRLVSTAGWDNRVCVWELATGERLASLPHPDWTFSALFSPDGQHLLTACRDNMARLWDWHAGCLVCPPFQHEHEVHAVAFTPDARHVLSPGRDHVLRVWEWRTGKPVCPPLALGGQGITLALTPDGSQVAIGGFFDALPVFHVEDWLTPAPLEPDDLCVWGEIESGQRVEEGGGVTNLTTEDWLERWRAFRERHPEHGEFELVRGSQQREHP